MTEFSFKTKLMSFNASLEASRAGENGRGFSLIADELAELAETSGAAAKEFNAMLHGRLNQASSIIGQSCSVLQEIANRSSQAENETNSTVLDCNKALRELMEDSLRMARFAQELRQASEAQALGFTELGRTICELEEMSRQNANASDAFAATADELAVRIINHKALLKNLSLMMTGQQESTSRLEQQAKNEEELPDQSSTGDGLQTDKSRLLTFRGKNLKKEKKTTRTQRFGQRARSEEFMRKAAGAEDIPFEKE